MIVQRINSLRGMAMARTLLGQIRTRINTRKLTEIAPVPPLIFLESSSMCNVGCAKCANKSSTRPQGIMKIDLAFDLLNRAAEMGIPSVCLSMLGEPLLNPYLERVVERARKLGMYVYIVTNATILTPERSRSLIGAGINRVTVSIDGWDQTSYGERHGGTNINLILDNLRSFNDIRSKCPNPPILSSNTVLDTESIKHLRKIKKLLSSYVDICLLNPLTDFGIPNQRINTSLLPGTRSWKRIPCWYFWYNINIGWDGQVTACCNDHNYLLVYHHVNKASLEEIWQSEGIRKFRRIHLDGEFHRMPMCGSCTRDWCNSLSFQRIKHKFDRISS